MLIIHAQKKKKKRILIPLGFFFLVMNGLFALIYAGVILLLELELIFPHSVTHCKYLWRQVLFLGMWH